MVVQVSSDAHEPAARSPPSSPRVVARDLPYELLHTIFRLASTYTSSSSTSTSRAPHGGAVRSWHSHEPAAPFSLVCRRWRSPAQAVLFSSVALVGHKRAQAFVDALERSERVRQLAKKETTYVVLALDAADEQLPMSSPTPAPSRQSATSELLVAALEACSSAAHVHVRTLHQAVRKRLLAALMDLQRPLVTLVLGPTHVAARRWSEALWDVRDGWDVRPEVENLEHTGLLASGLALPPTRMGQSVRDFPQLALRRLKLCHDWPIEILATALKNSPQLEFLDLYFEQYKPAQAMVDALEVSGKNLREVRYVCASPVPLEHDRRAEDELTFSSGTSADNPTSHGPDSGDSSSAGSPPSSHSPRPRRSSSPDPSSSSTSTRARRPAPLFNLLLPHLPSLRILHCTSTELTPSALLALPPSLQSLSVKSLNSFSRFSPRALLAVLRDPHLALPNEFARLTVTDSPDEWGDEAIDEARLRCEEVGVRFEFRMDFEEEDVYESE